MIDLPSIFSNFLVEMLSEKKVSFRQSSPLVCVWTLEIYDVWSEKSLVGGDDDD